MFSTQNVEFHSSQKNPLLKHYSMTSLLHLEEHVDHTVSYFMKRLEGELIDGSNNGGTCDLGKWFLYCQSSFSFLRR